MKLESSEIADIAGLNLSTSADAGFTRRKGPSKTNDKGKKVLNWHYLDQDGKRIKDADEISRMDSLAIPPAWTDVWICADPSGTLQAVGFDAKKRKQYRYHSEWTKTVSRLKFDSILDFAEALPRIRRIYRGDMKLEKIPKNKVIACIISLMDEFCIRVGSDEYAQKNQTYGLSTVLEEHIKVVRGKKAEGELDIKLTFPGKSGKEWERTIEDDDVCKIIIEARRVGGRDDKQDLFMYEDDNKVARDIKADHINEYLNEASDAAFTAKDFRTWKATWLAAKTFDEFDDPGTKQDRKRIETTVVGNVANHLGNTPAVCRSSYIHPAIIEDWIEGRFEERWAKAVAGRSKVKGLLKAEDTTLTYLRSI